MHFLLPDAERSRRVLACGAALVGSALLALWPLPAAERAAGALLMPVAAVVTPAAGWIADRVGAGPLEAAAAAASGAEELAAAPALASWERAAGRPPALRGVAWLEVPVAEVRLAEGWLLLSAGREHGLAEGQPVVFGDQWLGRILAAPQGRAVAELWSAPGARTGVWLAGERQELRAVLLGVRFAAPAVAAWVEAAGEPSPGMEVRWRPSEADPASLRAAGAPFRVGRLEPGPRRAGAAVWTVAGELPLGAEGRVFVGAEAVGPSLVAPPALVRAAARVILPVDGVLGAGWMASGPAEISAPAAVSCGGRVVGEVVGTRGGFQWVRRREPAAWGARALELSGGALYTRGLDGLPRGLRIGSTETLRRGSALEVVAARPLPPEEP